MPEENTPAKILQEIYANLRDSDPQIRLQGIARLHEINYSSEAILNELEIIALRDLNEDAQREANYALNLAPQRNARSRLNILNRRERQMILGEFSKWQERGLLDKGHAETLRRRYDFDEIPAYAPKLREAEKAQPVERSAPVPTGEATPPVETLRPAEPIRSKPAPTLAQTLTSEGSVKIALYLGAFFVIASAAIFGAFVEMFRIPLLVIGTVIFSGLSLALRKRLPQPSYTLFIIFSFFLPITANVLEDSMNLAPPLSAAYWIFVSAFMALVWGGSAWLYESRLSSILAFISLTVSLYRIGDVFETQSEFYSLSMSLAALLSLAGVWALKQWKDRQFAMPLFLSAQAVQAGALLFALINFFSRALSYETNLPLWNLASVVTLLFAFAFYAASDWLIPFILFRWAASATLLGIPFLISAAFEMEALGYAATFAIYGGVIALLSEGANYAEKFHKYSLPFLLSSTFLELVAVSFGFSDSIATGFVCSLAAGVLYAALHMLRPRPILWVYALLNLIGAYFAFFALPFMESVNIFMGYRLLILSVLFLLPEMFLKREQKNALNQRLVPLTLQTYGGLFAFAAFILYVVSGAAPLNVSILFGVYSAFFALYALVKRNALYGYLPALYLPLAVIYGLNYANADAWLPALTALAVLYFLAGAALRFFKLEKWSQTLRYSGLTLGTLTAFAALIFLKPYGGWYALIIGLLFIAEMYFANNGWMELGAPALFNIGAFLALRDLHVEEPAYHLLAYSALWLAADVLARLTFPHPRPTAWGARGLAALLSVINFGVLMFSQDAHIAAIGFGVYAALFLLPALVYREPNLFYAFTFILPLFFAYLLKNFEIAKWIHAAAILAALYYALGFALRSARRAEAWGVVLSQSGLSVAVFAALAALSFNGLDIALPAVIAATLFAAEAYIRKNAWLALPANALYVYAYFILLVQLDVAQLQFYSIGAALFGLVQHYLLMRAESKTGAFLMGMGSQLVLLGTAYIQMVANGSEGLIYFAALFFESVAVLAYGLVIRSRSLTLTPIAFAVIGVLSVLYIVVYNLLNVIATIAMVGCTGVLLIVFGIGAVLARERIGQVREKLSDWQA
ncbi:MAG: hypothetical protein Fur002_00610 [Anaerolineales bacterium]